MKKRTILLGLAVLLCFWLAVSRLEQGRQAQGAQQLEEVLRRAAVTCFVTEGFYPPSVAYMEEHYAVQYDHGVYSVGYEIFASNLMPNITVLEKQP